METTYKLGMTAAVAAGLALVSGQTYASDFYAGVSVGDATLEADDAAGDGLDFESNDTSFKLFGGYMFNDYFGVEIAYHDLGDQSDNWNGLDGGEFDVSVDAEVTGFSGQLVGQYPIGAIDLFAKVGLVAWDVEGDLKIRDNFFDETFRESADDDGSDLVWGFGARYNFGQWGVRAEYEVIDTDEFDDVYAWSIGAEYSFPM